ncbi:type VI secretion system baseplate subunit TssE [Enterobacter hormaechei]
MPKGHNTPSLYEMLSGNFSGGLNLNQVSEQNQVILSVLDNMQRILNCRAGTLAHLPDYGMPDMTKILQGMPGSAHQLITTLSAVLLKYEPRLNRINVVMQEQIQAGELRYAIDAELKGVGVGLVRYGTEFMPEGRVLIRNLKQQQYLDARAAI